MVKRLVCFVFQSFAYLVFLGTLLYAIAFVGGFAVPTRLDGVPHSPLGLALAIDAGLLAVFAVQHSVMARRVVQGMVDANRSLGDRAVDLCARRKPRLDAPVLSMAAAWRERVVGRQRDGPPGHLDAVRGRMGARPRDDVPDQPLRPVWSPAGALRRRQTSRRSTCRAATMRQKCSRRAVAPRRGPPLGRQRTRRGTAPRCDPGPSRRPAPAARRATDRLGAPCCVDAAAVPRRCAGGRPGDARNVEWRGRPAGRPTVTPMVTQSRRLCRPFSPRLLWFRSPRGGAITAPPVKGICNRQFSRRGFGADRTKSEPFRRSTTRGRAKWQDETC